MNKTEDGVSDTGLTLRAFMSSLSKTNSRGFSSNLTLIERRYWTLGSPVRG